MKHSPPPPNPSVRPWARSLRTEPFRGRGCRGGHVGVLGDAGPGGGRRTHRRLAYPPWRLMLRAPLFGTAATYAGLVTTQRAWADCTLGNDAGAGFALTVGVIVGV